MQWFHNKLTKFSNINEAPRSKTSASSLRSELRVEDSRVAAGYSGEGEYIWAAGLGRKIIESDNHESQTAF